MARSGKNVLHRFPTDLLYSPDVKDPAKWIYLEENARSEVVIKGLPESTEGTLVDPSNPLSHRNLNAKGRMEERRLVVQALQSVDPNADGSGIKHISRFKQGDVPRNLVVGFRHIDYAQKFLAKCLELSRHR